MYETVCILLQFGWLIAIFATHLIIHFFLRLRFKKTLTFLLGYIIGLVCVYAYWWYAAEYAPTEEIQNEIYSKDGAPKLFAPFVMPFFVLFGYLVLSPILWLICKIKFK